MNSRHAILLSTEQIRNWDLFTMEDKGISSHALMERASHACYTWLLENGYGEHSFSLFCGKGNNGGDGLALARMLCGYGCTVTANILEPGHTGTADFETNLTLLNGSQVTVSFITEKENLPVIKSGDIVIDALFGSGLNRPLERIAGLLVEHINKSGNEIIAIDIPSGMFADSSSFDNTRIQARHTLSFETYKPAFFVGENEAYCGTVHILTIGLSPSYPDTVHPFFEMINSASIKKIYKRRSNFTHKGTYGHAALVAGSEYMMGAAVLAARACMRSGAGKLTCYIPANGSSVIQISIPEAMTATSLSDKSIYDGGYNAIGIGPGMGKQDANAAILLTIFQNCRALVIDADALNTLAEEGEILLKKIPPNSILTPHPKEFERLFGKTANDFERIYLAQKKAMELNVIIVLKGYNTFIATPGGRSFFNTTGNPGMATAGSGDVLTGILTGLLAQGYSPMDAAVMGVFMHGLAGDIAAVKVSQEALIASDIIQYLGDAFLTL